MTRRTVSPLQRSRVATAVQLIALAAFFLGLIIWAPGQFAWPSWLVLIALLAIYAVAGAYRRTLHRRPTAR